MQNIWAPWRLEYILDTEPKGSGCFLCNAWNATGKDAEHLILARGQKAFVMMNRYPYNNAHLMVAPITHAGNIEDIEADEAADMWALTVLAKSVLAEVVQMDGCNIGINQGKVAGAGVLDHLHIHIVPRWNGDTNFMPVIADVKVMPEALDACYRKLRPAFQKRGF